MWPFRNNISLPFLLCTTWLSLSGCSDKVSTFNVAEVFPPDGATGVDTHAAIAIIFDSQINGETLTPDTVVIQADNAPPIVYKPYVSRHDGTNTPELSTSLIALDAALAPNTHYTLSLSPELTDIDGRTLANREKVYEFTTGPAPVLKTPPSQRISGSSPAHYLAAKTLYADNGDAMAVWLASVRKNEYSLLYSYYDVSTDTWSNDVTLVTGLNQAEYRFVVIDNSFSLAWVGSDGIGTAIWNTTNRNWKTYFRIQDSTIPIVPQLAMSTPEVPLRITINVQQLQLNGTNNIFTIAWQQIEERSDTGRQSSLYVAEIPTSCANTDCQLNPSRLHTALYSGDTQLVSNSKGSLIAWRYQVDRSSAIAMGASWKLANQPTWSTVKELAKGRQALLSLQAAANQNSFALQWFERRWQEDYASPDRGKNVYVNVTAIGVESADGNLHWSVNSPAKNQLGEDEFYEYIDVFDTSIFNKFIGIDNQFVHLYQSFFSYHVYFTRVSSAEGARSTELKTSNGSGFSLTENVYLADAVEINSHIALVTGLVNSDVLYPGHTFRDLPTSTLTPPDNTSSPKLFFVDVAGTESLIDVGTPLPNLIGNAFTPRLSAHNGNVITSWTQTEVDTQRSNVRIATMDTEHKFLATKRLSPVRQVGAASQPITAVNENGDIASIWRQSANGQTQIFAAIRHEKQWLPPQQITTGLTPEVKNCYVFAKDTGFLALWSTPDNILWRDFAADGTLGDIHRLSKSGIQNFLGLGDAVVIDNRVEAVFAFASPIYGLTYELLTISSDAASTVELIGSAPSFDYNNVRYVANSEWQGVAYGSFRSTPQKLYLAYRRRGTTWTNKSIFDESLNNDQFLSSFVLNGSTFGIALSSWSGYYNRNISVAAVTPNNAGDLDTSVRQYHLPNRNSVHAQLFNVKDGFHLRFDARRDNWPIFAGYDATFTKSGGWSDPIFSTTSCGYNGCLGAENYGYNLLQNEIAGPILLTTMTYDNLLLTRFDFASNTWRSTLELHSSSPDGIETLNESVALFNTKEGMHLLHVGYDDSDPENRHVPRIVDTGPF